MDRKRILLVEDDRALAQVLEAELRRAYHTRVVHAGRQALILAGSEPFDMLEFLARVYAQLRRPGGGEAYASGPIVVSARERVCLVAGEPLSLTRCEFELLVLLLANAGRVYTKATLEERLYDDGGPGSNALEVLVSRLRSRPGLRPRRRLRGALLVRRRYPGRHAGGGHAPARCSRRGCPWALAAEATAWLDAHVGPSEIPSLGRR